MGGFIGRMFPFVSILELWSEPSYHRVCPQLSTVLILAPSCFVLPFNLKDITTQHTATVFITLCWAGGLSTICVFEQDPQPQIALDGHLFVLQAHHHQCGSVCMHRLIRDFIKVSVYWCWKGYLCSSNGWLVLYFTDRNFLITTWWIAIILCTRGMNTNYIDYPLSLTL